MAGSQRPSLKEFLLKTKLGRMSLLTAILAFALVAVPYGCSKKATLGGAEVEGKRTGPGATKAAGEDTLPGAPTGFQDTLTLGQKYDALISRWGSDLSSTRTDLDATRKELESLRNAIGEEKTAQTNEKKQLMDVLREVQQGLRRDLGPASNGEPGGEGIGQAAPSAPHALRAISLRDRSAGAKRARRMVHIPAASGGLATLMNGVFAPTTGEPSPVRLRFDAALLGPNRSRMAMRDAFLIGKAQGDANSSRVTIQVDRLSYVSAEGRPVETKVLGYVVAEDGIEGVPGSYEWRATELLPLAVVGSGVSAGSESLALGETNRSLTPLGGAIDAVTGNPLKYAGLKSLAGGTGKLSDLVVERMKEIRPAVSARPGQQVTVVFLEGVTLEGLAVEEIEHGKDSDPFRGLDIHR